MVRPSTVYIFFRTLSLIRLGLGSWNVTTMGWCRGPLNSPMNGQPNCHRSHPFSGARVSSFYIYLALVLPFSETLAAGGGGEESVVAGAAMVNTSMVTDFWFFLFLLDCDFILHLFLLSFFFQVKYSREPDNSTKCTLFFYCTVMISCYVFFWLPENIFWRTTPLNLLEVLVKIFSGSRILGNQRG